MRPFLAVMLVSCACAGAEIRPGHRGNTSDPGFLTRALEQLDGRSREGLPLELEISVTYREQNAPLYETEVRPELRRAIREAFARRSYLDLLGHDAAIEDEIETALHDRLFTRHVEVKSVVVERVGYSPRLAALVRESQDLERERLTLEAELHDRESMLDTLHSHGAEFWDRSPAPPSGSAP
jgi:hypothetical protein